MMKNEVPVIATFAAAVRAQTSHSIQALQTIVQEKETVDFLEIGDGVEYFLSVQGTRPNWGV